MVAAPGQPEAQPYRRPRFKAFIASSLISRYETGALAPTPSTAAVLAEHPGVRLAELADVNAPLALPLGPGDGAELLLPYGSLDAKVRDRVLALARLARGRLRQR
jgi:hypothetical protein